MNTEKYSVAFGTFKRGDEVVTTQQIRPSTIALREKNRRYITVPKGTPGRIVYAPVSDWGNQVPVCEVETVYGVIAIPEYFLDYA